MPSEQALKQHNAARRQLFNATIKQLTAMDKIKHIQSMKIYQKCKENFQQNHKN